MATVRFLGGNRGPEGRGPEGRGPEGRGPEGRGPDGRGPDGPSRPSGRANRVGEPTPLRRDAGREREARALEELPAIPEKIYFRIGEVAHLVGVEPHVLRYWEHEFRSIRPTKSQRGQRVYSRRDVEHLRRIRGLLYEQGFTIAGAKKALRARGLEPHDDRDPTLLAAARARDALLSIRSDVEAFLRELGG
jgi:DNA-binding transcriptional MerR regulator